MGRPRKTQTAEPINVSASADSNELQAKIDMLQKALLEKAAEVEAHRIIGHSAHGGQRIVVQNCGYVTLSIPIEGEGSVILKGKGPSSIASIPMHVYARLQRGNWFKQGLLKVVGEPTDNPNIIDDPAQWLENLSPDENKVTDAVNKITAEGPLNRLWNHLEYLPKLSGKELLVKKAIQVRFAELFDVQLVEDAAIP